MSISKKYDRLIDEYLIDLNAQKAGERVGYSSKSARQTVYKALQKPEVKAELERRMAKSRVSPGEVIRRMEAMADGSAPTKTITGSHAREEFDTKAATDSLAKIYALFIDKQIVENIGLEIIDDDEEG